MESCNKLIERLITQKKKKIIETFGFGAKRKRKHKNVSRVTKLYKKKKTIFFTDFTIIIVLNATVRCLYCLI